MGCLISFWELGSLVIASFEPVPIAWLIGFAEGVFLVREARRLGIALTERELGKGDQDGCDTLSH